MATGRNDATGQAGDDADRRVPTEDEYVAATADSRWVDLVDFQGQFQVQEVPPLKLLRSMRQYGVEAMLGADGGEQDMADVVGGDGFDQFVEEVLLPNILAPNCYWSDIGDGDFDLANLTADDLMAVIAGMTGQDQEELQEEATDRFPE